VISGCGRKNSRNSQSSCPSFGSFSWNFRKEDGKAEPYPREDANSSTMIFSGAQALRVSRRKEGRTSLIFLPVRESVPCLLPDGLNRGTGHLKQRERQCDRPKLVGDLRTEVERGEELRVEHDEEDEGLVLSAEEGFGTVI